MRVFVTGTGRCGSVSFWKACQFIENYTAAHETINGNLLYSTDHIEVNPMLRGALPILIDKYPDALYVHLIRDRAKCVESLAAMADGETMHAYRRVFWSLMEDDPERIAERYYDWENASIASDLLGCRHAMTFHLGDRYNHWELFWKRIGAVGNYEGSLDTWATRHNTREERGEA